MRPLLRSRKRETSTASDNDEEDSEDSYEPTGLRSYSVVSDTTKKPIWQPGDCRQCCAKIPLLFSSIRFPDTIDPQSKFYISWLFIVTLCFMYNAYCIFLRTAFPYQTSDNIAIWIALDYFSDFIYALDIIVFKVRIKFLKDGLLVVDRRETCKNYMKTIDFKFDLLALLPLDIFYIVAGVQPLLRFPRIFKIRTFWEFFTRFDNITHSPQVIRVLKTLSYMLFLIHLNACSYYAFSEYEGLGNNSWVYQGGNGFAYIRCFYFATKTATSIGNNPKPQNNGEYLFMTFNWLMGIFVFALLIGQIRDILATTGSQKANYRKNMDQTMAYLRAAKVPSHLQDRVRLWFNYNWQRQKALNENVFLDTLPEKMKADIAINVHFQTLRKVKLFQDCDKALLRDLVLKLKSVIFLPGDYICKKGEVGREMYIVNHGQVQVVGGESNSVLATLYEGSVFGEISLLELEGGNRRTADVRSRGFSNLFVLSKSDLREVIKFYPDAQEILRKKAKTSYNERRKLIRQNAARQRKSDSAECIIKKKETPKLVQTLIQCVIGVNIPTKYNNVHHKILVVNSKSKVGKLLGQNSSPRQSSEEAPSENNSAANSIETHNHLYSEDEDNELLVVEITNIEPDEKDKESSQDEFDNDNDINECNDDIPCIPLSKKCKVEEASNHNSKLLNDDNVPHVGEEEYLQKPSVVDELLYDCYADLDSRDTTDLEEEDEEDFLFIDSPFASPSIKSVRMRSGPNSLSQSFNASNNNNSEKEMSVESLDFLCASNSFSPKTPEPLPMCDSLTLIEPEPKSVRFAAEFTESETTSEKQDDTGNVSSSTSIFFESLSSEDDLTKMAQASTPDERKNMHNILSGNQTLCEVMVHQDDCPPAIALSLSGGFDNLAFFPGGGDTAYVLDETKC